MIEFSVNLRLLESPENVFITEPMVFKATSWNLSLGTKGTKMKPKYVASGVAVIFNEK